MSTRDSTYVQTGDNFLTKMSNWISLTPIPIPVVGLLLNPLKSSAVMVLGVAGGMWDAAGWLLKGKPLSAITTMGAHTASAAVNSATSLIPFWGWAANSASAAMTGRTLGTHVRKGVEMATGAITQPLGFQPTVLRSYPAGIGSTGGAQQAPGYWANRVSQQSGRDPNQQWAEYVRAQQGAQMGMQRG